MDGEARPMNEELGFLANLIGEEKKPVAPSLAPAPGSVKVADGPAPTKLEEAGIAPIADQLSAWFGDMPKPTAAQRSGGWVFGDEAPAAPEQTQSESPTGEEDEEDSAPPPANYLAERAARHVRLSRIIEKAVATIQIHGDGGKDEKKDTKKKPEKKSPPKGKDDAPAADAGADAPAPGAQPAPVDPVAQEEETLSFVRSLLKKGGYLFHSDLNLDGTHVSKAGKNYLAVYDEPTDSVMIQDESGKTITTKPLAEVRPQPMMDPNAPPPAGPKVPVDQTPPPGPGVAGGAAVATDKAAMSSGDDDGAAQTITPASAGDSGSVPPLPAEPPQTSQKPAVALPGGMVSLAIQRVAAGEDPAVVAQDLKSAGAPPADQQQMTMRAPAKAAPQAAESFERACRYAQVEPRIVEYTGENILPYVIMECSGTTDQIEIVYSTLIYEGVDENAMLVHPAAVNVHPENMGGYNAHTLSEAAEIFGVSEQALMASNNVVAVHPGIDPAQAQSLTILGAHVYGLLEQANSTESDIVVTESAIQDFGRVVRLVDEKKFAETQTAVCSLVEAVEGRSTLVSGALGLFESFAETSEDTVAPSASRYHPHTVFATRALKEALLKMGFQIITEGDKIMAEFASSAPWTEESRQAAGQALREAMSAFGLGVTLDWSGRKVAASLNHAHVHGKPELLTEGVGETLARAMIRVFHAARGSSATALKGAGNAWSFVRTALPHVVSFMKSSQDVASAVASAIFISISLFALVRQLYSYVFSGKASTLSSAVATRDVANSLYLILDAAKDMSQPYDATGSEQQQRNLEAKISKARDEIARTMELMRANYKDQPGANKQMDALQQAAGMLDSWKIRFEGARVFGRSVRGSVGAGHMEADDAVVDAYQNAFSSVLLRFLNSNNSLFVEAGQFTTFEKAQNRDEFVLREPQTNTNVLTQSITLPRARIVPVSSARGVDVADATVTLRIERSVDENGIQYNIGLSGGLLAAAAGPLREAGYGHKDEHDAPIRQRASVFRSNLGGVITNMFRQAQDAIEGKPVYVGAGQYKTTSVTSASTVLSDSYKISVRLVNPNSAAIKTANDIAASGLAAQARELQNTVAAAASLGQHEVGSDELRAALSAGEQSMDYVSVGDSGSALGTARTPQGVLVDTIGTALSSEFEADADVGGSAVKRVPGAFMYTMTHAKGATLKFYWKDASRVVGKSPRITFQITAPTLDACRAASSALLDAVEKYVDDVKVELKKSSSASPRGGFEAAGNIVVETGYTESEKSARTSIILERVKSKDQFQSNPRMKRMYKHIKKGYLDKGMDTDKAQELAARTVHKYRAGHGLTKAAIAAKKAKTRAENALKTESLADLGTRVIEGTILANRKLTIEEAAEMTGISPILILDVLRAFEGTGYAVTEGVGYGMAFTFTDKARQLAKKAVNA